MAVIIRQILFAVSAAALCILATCSFFRPFLFCHHTGADWIVLGLYEGRVRVFWLDVTKGGIHLDPHESQPMVLITPVIPNGPPLGDNLAGPDLARTRAFWEERIRMRGLRRSPPFGGAWRQEYRIARRHGIFATGVFISYVRFPAWLPAIGLLIWPIRFAVQTTIRRRRRDRGRCVACGYDLRALPQSRCPECGTSFAAASS